MSNENQLPREQQVILHGLASGLSVKEIAFQTGWTVKSVDSHKYRLMKHLGLRNRIELTRYAIENGIVQVMHLEESPEPSQLSDRQREVVALTADGLSVKEMAELLQISTRSADAHKHKAMHRLDIHDAVRLVHYCVRHDLTAAEVTRPKPESTAPDEQDTPDRGTDAARSGTDPAGPSADPHE